MECNVFNRELVRISALPFLSLVWEESYSDSGMLQVVFYKTPKATASLQLGYYIGIPESDTLMLITGIEERGKELWATGAEAKILLKNRVFVGTINGGVIEEKLRAAFSAVSPIGTVELGDSAGLPAKTDSQASHIDLFELSKTWCEPAGYGFRFRFNYRQKKFFYEVVNGEEKLQVKFSSDYGNSGAITLKMTEANFKNVAIVGGEGEGAERVFVTVGDISSSGLDRREMFVDARDLQKEEGMSAADYEKILAARGLEKLAEQIRRVEVDIESVSTTKFKKDYSLGDKIYIVLREYAMYAIMPVTAVNYVFEGNKKKTSLILGNPIYRSYKK